MNPESQKPRSHSRRVQWLDHTSPPPAHLLDEYGLDIHAFQSLTSALEEHKRAPLGQVHYYPPEPQPQPEHEVPSPDTPTAQYSNPTLNDSSSFIPLLGSGSGTQTPYSISSASSLDGHEHERDLESRNIPSESDSEYRTRSRLIEHLRSRKDARSNLPNNHEHSGAGDIENPPPTHTSKGILSTLLDLYSPLHSGYTSGCTSASSSDPALPSSSSSHKQKEKPHKKPLHIPRPNLNLITCPSQARTSGGVVGALIASTGNISGWAAPTPSTVQPDLKRPGYRLTRYTSDAVPTLSTLRPALVRRASDSATSTLFPANENKENKEERPTTPPPSPVIPPSPWGFKEWRKSWTSLSSDKEKEKSHSGDENRKRRKPRKKRIKQDIYITQHLSDLLARQNFLLTLTRCMMQHGAPPHRLPAQLTSAARVLGIELNVFYLPDIMLLSFDDTALGTSQIKMIRQSSALDLGKLDDAYQVYWKVIHDTLSVTDASEALSSISTKPPQYNTYISILLGGLCASSICTVSFSGSFLDALTSFPLGCLLVAIQILSARNVLYSYVFEVTITTLISLLSAFLSTTHILCYSAILSSSVVLILPGFLVLTGSLELLSRHLVSGSVRICYAVFYALILGFGFTIGAQFYELVMKRKVYGLEDYSCEMSHDPLGGWYQRTPSKLWAFLTVPLFSLFLSLKNQAPYNRKELPMLVGIACIGWVTNYFTGTHFINQTDITAAVGAFAVGLVGNLCARFFKGNAFVIMITGILFQLPSGLGTGGLLSYASEQTGGSPDSYIAGFRSALKLVSVAIGLAIGLGLSLSVTHPIQSKRREAGIFSL